VVKVLPQLDIIKRAALELFFPQKCIGCGKAGEILCRSCKKSFIRIVSPICPKCGKPQPDGIICPKCVSWRNNIDGIRSPFKFDGTLREAILQFKYKNLTCLAKPLAILLNEYMKYNPLSVQAIIPVPLNSKRLRERGYNQSDLLAKELSKLTSIPEDTGCLKRTKYVLPQAKTKSLEERLNNTYQAFSCINSRVRYSSVLLLDDVSTSGATLDACAKALKDAGVLSVWGLVLAREL
jgi:ComF family protein